MKFSKQLSIPRAILLALCLGVLCGIRMVPGQMTGGDHPGSVELSAPCYKAIVCPPTVGKKVCIPREITNSENAIDPTKKDPNGFTTSDTSCGTYKLPGPFNIPGTKPCGPAGVNGACTGGISEG
jgi:hypothetical protein